MEKELEKIWRDSGYGGVARLWSLAKGKITGLKQKDVQDFIASQEAAQLHKKPPKQQNAGHITAPGNHLLYSADLLDMTNYQSANRGYKWILLVEDISSRKSYAGPLKSKSPNDVLPEMNKAFEYLGQPKLTLTTDSGGEFKGVVGKRLKDLHISHQTVDVGDHHALGIIDSLARFFKHAIHKHFTHTQTTNWIDYMPTLLEQYNATPHKGLKGMTPTQAETRETDTVNIAYDMVTKDAKPLKYAVGDTVRVKKTKGTFEHGYTVRYSIERFTIDKIEGNKYVLSNGKKYREHELQKVVPKKEEPKVIEEPVAEPKKDVAAAARFDARTDYKLKHEEGVSQSNRREGLRERKPANQVEHSKYGKINW